jgi:hypothetical protein
VQSLIVKQEDSVRQASAMPVGGFQREVAAVMAPDQGSRGIVTLLRKGTRTMPPP